MNRKQRIRAAFSAAAGSYDGSARAQEKAADLLAERLGDTGRPVRVLELGCGTGLLTRRLVAALPAGSDILATDLSPAMVEAADKALPGPRFAVMDAEAPDTAGPFDLIVSSLAAQWFGDLEGSLKRLAALLAPGGRMVIVTLGGHTFAQWRAAHTALGLECGVPDYPEPESLAALLPGARVERVEVVLDYAHGRDFLHALAGIGARTPRPGHRPLPPGALRRILTVLGAPCPITWDFLLLDHLREEGA